MAQPARFQVSQLVADRFQVLDRLGGGEFTETYKVTDTVANRVLALKTLRTGAPKSAEARLNREFYSLSRFSHPGIVTALDYGSTPDGQPYFTMEFIEGVPINVFFGKGFRPELKTVTVQLLEALARVHAQGLIHCDLKPQNILVADKDGSLRARLIDFGFAGQPALSDADAARGTLGYVAPEVLKGVDTDARADLYSLGLVLYEVIAGQGPGKDRDLRKWLRMQYLSEFKPPREFDENIPEDFASLVMSLIQREPERRPRSAAAVIEQLTHPKGEPAVEIGPPEYSVAPGFVGRGDELAGLKEMLDNASKGRAGSACVTGERGVGKSRLLSEFKFMAQLEGATILSFERASLGARQPSLVEMIRGYLSTSSVADMPAGDESRDAAPGDKYRLFEAVLHGLKEMSASPRVRHSLVLLVDDLELYDSDSLQFLRYLVFGLSNERLMVLVAGVSEARFLDLVAEFGRTGCFQHFQLPPLDQAEVTDLLASLVDEMPGTDELAEWLTRTTGGNSLFVVEAIRALIEGGILSRRGNRWTLVPGALNTYKTPESVADVLRRRLETLAAIELEVLEVSATIAGPFTLAFLRAVEEQQDEAALSGAVGKLRSLGLLRSLVIDGEATFVLSSKMLEAAINEGMRASVRRENHRRVALVIEALHPEKTDQLLFDLAHHYAQAGIEDRAFNYSLQAGTRARERRLSEQALGYFETALALAAQAATAREKVELHERVGELREATGRYPEAIDAYTQGMAIIAADAELAQDQELSSRFRRRVGLVQQKQGHHYEALDNFNQALLLQPDRGAPAYIDTLNDMGWSYYALRGYGRADQLVSAALRLSENLKNRTPAVYSRLSARSFYQLSVLAWSRSDLVLAQQLVERSLEIYAGIDAERTAGEVSQFLATLWWSRGNIAKARDQYQRCLPAQRRSGEVYSLLRSLQGLGIIYQAECEWDKAYNCFAEALNLAERIGDDTAIASAKQL